MKWLAFTVAIVAGLIGLGVWSVMPPGVVWEGRVSYCSRCRAEVRHYARQCSTCDRSLRWTSTEEDCKWCLTKEDADYLKDAYRDLKLEETAHVGLLKQFPKAYYVAMEQGACAACAGLGKVRHGDAEVVCSVCRGGTRCIKALTVVITTRPAAAPSSAQARNRVRASMRRATTSRCGETRS